eukprot:2906692-Rhodomonas_salina.3
MRGSDVGSGAAFARSGPRQHPLLQPQTPSLTFGAPPGLLILSTSPRHKITGKPAPGEAMY